MIYVDLPGEVSEWLMVADSKSVLGLHPTEVRILSSLYLDNWHQRVGVAAPRGNRPLIYIKGVAKSALNLLQ